MAGQLQFDVSDNLQDYEFKLMEHLKQICISIHARNHSMAEHSELKQDIADWLDQMNKYTEEIQGAELTSINHEKTLQFISKGNQILSKATLSTEP